MFNRPDTPHAAHSPLSHALCGLSAFLSVLSFTLLALYVLIAAYLPLNLAFYEERSPLLLSPDGHYLASENAPDTRLKLYTAPEDVALLYLKTLIAVEDERFYSHPGVDGLALIRALASNLRAGEVVSGGSTLAMQVARMLNPGARTVKSKLREAVTALSLTSRLGRTGILRLYLTIAPMGGYLHGVRAGALRYFGHEPSHLSPAEAALLVALPRSPERVRPDLEQNRERAFRLRTKVLERAVSVGLVKRTVLTEARLSPLPARLMPLNAPAPHLGQRVFKLARAAGLKEREFYAPISEPLMARLEKIRVQLAADDPAISLAFIAVDNRTHQVIAYVGSAHDHVEEDLTHALRSPGSALKPFLYAQAFDLKLLHPLTVLSDRALSATGYTPRNYDNKERGEITVRDALILSLNLPALETLKAVRPARFVSLLNSGGRRLILPQGAAPSLPVILGGVGVTPYALTELYTALNPLNDGLLPAPALFCTDRRLERCYADRPQISSHSVKLSPLNENPPPLRLFTPSSARAVYEILKAVPRPQGFGELRELSYKTGTAHRFTDLLVAGNQGPLSAVLWMGRRDGRPMDPVPAYQKAAPLFAQALESVPSLQAPGLPPTGALSATPPEALKKLNSTVDVSLLETLEDNELRFIYPLPDETLYLPSGNLAMEVTGTAPPFELIYKGRIIARSESGLFELEGITEGFYRFTVRDRLKHTRSIRLRVSSDPFVNSSEENVF